MVDEPLTNGGRVVAQVFADAECGRPSAVVSPLVQRRDGNAEEVTDVIDRQRRSHDGGSWLPPLTSAARGFGRLTTGPRLFRVQGSGRPADLIMTSASLIDAVRSQQVRGLDARSPATVPGP